MIKSNYSIEQTMKSYCPKCSKLVHLLGVNEVTTKPAFFICFPCQWIGEVGVGEVTSDDHVYTSSGEQCESTWGTYEEAYQDLVKGKAWGVILKHLPYNFDDEVKPEEVKVYEHLPNLNPHKNK